MTVIVVLLCLNCTLTFGCLSVILDIEKVLSKLVELLIEIEDEEDE